MRANHKKTRTKCFFWCSVARKVFAAARCRKSFSVHEFVVDSVLFPTKNFNEKKFPDFLQQFFSLVPLRKTKKFWILLREPKSWQKQKNNGRKSCFCNFEFVSSETKKWNELKKNWLEFFDSVFFKVLPKNHPVWNLCYQIIFEKKIGLNCGWEEKLWKLLLPDKLRKKICPKPSIFKSDQIVRTVEVIQAWRLFNSIPFWTGFIFDKMSFVLLHLSKKRTRNKFSNFNVTGSN